MLVESAVPSIDVVIELVSTVIENLQSRVVTLNDVDDELKASLSRTTSSVNDVVPRSTYSSEWIDRVLSLMLMYVGRSPPSEVVRV